jgi:hypothetical protein
VRSAVLQVIGIVRIAMLTGREALIKNSDSKDARIHQLESEVAMLREELRINGACMRQRSHVIFLRSSSVNSFRTVSPLLR